MNQPTEYEFNLDPRARYRADVIEPWVMTLTAVEGVFSSKLFMKLPGKPYPAVCFEKID